MKNVEKVLPRWPFAYWILVREVPDEEVVASELWVQVLHRQLLIVRHLDVGDVLLLNELLLVGQHLLQEVLVDQSRWRQVELQA